ncbi:hypothetical protein C3497_07645 [Zoogloeaceae bacteirum Par-f-2]|nr:hypothetical protein C3497_07645 [Zoogloeaceae bacteirum Par-f-2]
MPHRRIDAKYFASSSFFRYESNRLPITDFLLQNRRKNHSKTIELKRKLRFYTAPVRFLRIFAQSLKAQMLQRKTTGLSASPKGPAHGNR